MPYNILINKLKEVYNSETKTMTSQEIVTAAKATNIFLINDIQINFIEFVLSNYIESEMEQLNQEKLPILHTNKYQSLKDAKDVLC